MGARSSEKDEGTRSFSSNASRASVAISLPLSSARWCRMASNSGDKSICSVMTVLYHGSRVWSNGGADFSVGSRRHAARLRDQSRSLADGGEGEDWGVLMVLPARRMAEVREAVLFALGLGR